jgi:hypothetical protein
MSPANFSNGGVDTFDPRKRYIGIRLQQGVPLLDRDWNELEDIRRYVERTIRQHSVGDGVPDLDGFRLRAPGFPADNDVVISGGHCTIAGYEVWNIDEVLYSEQGDRQPLPAPDGQNSDVLTVYLEPEIIRVDASMDPDLRNAQDINLETCVRDQIRWTVRAIRQPALPPTDTYVLAEIRRGPTDKRITDAMIVDKRRTMVNLANAVDRITSAESRLTVLERAIRQAQVDIDSMKQDLGRLFWDVRVESSTVTALFGGKATINVTVTDRLGTPVAGATVAFTTDWGALEPAVASTNAQGRAAIDLIGVKTDGPIRSADIGLLQRVGQKVQAAVLANPGAIEYARVKFEPDELTVVSRYTPAALITDIGAELPSGPIVAQPDWRTATVTVHAKEGQGAVVRGVGSVQVRFGLWVRDWVRTKVFDVTSKVAVGARIGDLMRQGFEAELFDHNRITEKLPNTMQAIVDDTKVILKESLYADAGVRDIDLQGSGAIGQVVAQEATAAIGARANDAITTQLEQFVAAPDVPMNAGQAEVARTHIVQKSSQITAGFSQDQKQLFTTARSVR